MLNTSSKTRQTPRCEICGRALTNTQSINRGIGPECLEMRSSFVAAVGSSVVEVETLALSADATVRRNIRIAMRALGAGRWDHARRFFIAAREAA